MEEEYEGYVNNQLITYVLKDGVWEGEMEFSQARLTKEGEWENEKVKFSHKSEDLEKLSSELMFTALSFLEPRGGNLFVDRKERMNGKTDGDEVTE